MSMIESKKKENQIYEASFTTHEASIAALETHVDRLLDQLNRDETYEPQDFDDEDEGEEQNEEFTLYLTNTMEWSTISSHKDEEDGYNTDDHNNSLHDPNFPVKGHHEESVPLKVKEEVTKATTTPYLKTLKEIMPSSIEDKKLREDEEFLALSLYKDEGSHSLEESISYIEQDVEVTHTDLNLP
nr:hypothetical protein [Tanacetum cinerariifolium]GEX81575.1 hypothetical protein [Tanacetum cinerariifolium]GEX83257.1 hypothetical protein [Tanacetum cinerariifolium]